jgi:hypothetical protein
MKPWQGQFVTLIIQSISRAFMKLPGGQDNEVADFFDFDGTLPRRPNQFPRSMYFNPWKEPLPRPIGILRGVKRKQSKPPPRTTTSKPQCPPHY